MASTTKPENPVCDPSSPNGDFAVQPVRDQGSIPVDGPVLDGTTVLASPSASTSEEEHASPVPAPNVPGSDGLHSIKSSLLAPRFHTGQMSIGSDTTLDDEDVRVDAVKDSDVSRGDSTTGEGEIAESEDTSGAADTSYEAEAENTDEDVVAQTSDAHTKVDAPIVDAIQAPTATKITAQQITASQEPTKDENTDSPSRNHTTTQQAEDIAVTDAEEVELESESLQSKRSIPPHMRSDLQSRSIRQPAHLNQQYPIVRSLGVSRYTDIPRAPRFQAPNHGFGNYNTSGSREESARLNALLVKTRNELDIERQKNANMRKSVEQELQKTTDEALAASTLELLNKQMKTLAQQAKVEAKERELQFREARIEQLEVYLSEGQKYIHRQTTGDEGLSMSAVVSEHESRQRELLAKKSIADREAKVAIRLESLQIREAAQQMREVQYKALIRGSFENELRVKSTPDMKIKLDEIAELEFNRGYGEGKTAGRKEAVAENRQKSFFEGYDACHRAQAALQNMRAGRISRDSPELDFLYDPSHPRNAYNVAMHSGEVVLPTLKSNGIGCNQQKTNSVAVKPTQDQVKVEEPVHNRLPLPLPPPPRATFASELRGITPTMHNGQHVLANGSSSPSAIISKINGKNGNATPNGADNDLYVGRCIVQYDESGEDNLIDLC